MNLYFLAEITFDLSEKQPVCIIRQSVFNKLFHVCGVQPGSTESCVLAILDTVTSCVLCWGIQMWHSLSSVATVLIYCISECFIQQLTTLAANGLPPCAQSPQIIIKLKFWKQPLLSYMAEICLWKAGLLEGRRAVQRSRSCLNSKWFADLICNSMVS